MMHLFLKNMSVHLAFSHFFSHWKFSPTEYIDDRLKEKKLYRARLCVFRSSLILETFPIIAYPIHRLYLLHKPRTGGWNGDISPTFYHPLLLEGGRSHHFVFNLIFPCGLFSSFSFQICKSGEHAFLFFSSCLPGLFCSVQSRFVVMHLRKGLRA